MTPSLLKRLKEELNNIDDEGRLNTPTKEIVELVRAALLEMKGEIEGEKNVEHNERRDSKGHKMGLKQANAHNAAIDDCIAILTRALEE